MRFLFTLFGIYAIILAYGFLLPRERINIPEPERIVTLAVIPAEPETLRIENPLWVKPGIIEHSVTVTIYHAVEGQTDSTPNILADGTVIDPAKAGSYRFCALSRNLLERWDGPYAYGDTIYLENAGKFSGPWIVRDTMNKRFTNRMDLLVDLDTRLYKFDVATIWKGI